MPAPADRLATTVLIVAGGSAPSSIDREHWPPADVVIAADSGVDHALDAGLRVDLVIGDLDSARPESLHAVVSAGAVIERFPPDKDETDLELALEAAVRRAPDRVVITGVGGGRIDHLVANLLLAASPRYAATRIEIVSDDTRMFVVHDRVAIDADVGQLVTLLPMHGPAVGVTTTGLRYSLAGDTLPAGSPRGVSNVVEASPVTVAIEHGVLLAIVGETDRRSPEPGVRRS
jgi:thiamine pyrophosphokinase